MFLPLFVSCTRSFPAFVYSHCQGMFPSGLCVYGQVLLSVQPEQGQHSPARAYIRQLNKSQGWATICVLRAASGGATGTAVGKEQLLSSLLCHRGWLGALGLSPALWGNVQVALGAWPTQMASQRRILVFPTAPLQRSVGHQEF